TGRLICMLFLILTMNTELLAQKRGDQPPRPDEKEPAPISSRFESWIRGQGMLFGNFFQASDPALEEDVTALQGEIGTAFQVSPAVPLELYGSLSYLQYDDEALDSSPGFRVGVRSDGRPHAFDLSFSQQNDRPTFDVGDTFDRADVSRLYGQYGYRVARDWEVTVRGESEWQKNDLTPFRDNDFLGFGGSVRYRGSRVFSPEIGYTAGRRDVDDETQSYDQQDLFFQVRSALTPAIYWSARYRYRTREYINEIREDDRNQISGYVDFTILPPLALTLYGSWEDVDSNLEGRDFDTTMVMAGLTYKF
ncbi:MAG: outer membrane beta-barrel protein, partial [Acidobacteria bacterium]|nr:outer membrane beta-barrel protein [Acidobacteriota bacterium]